ncbi:TPM domain-containing protein [Ferruginibacter sp. SUN106]|uniref:TPM domain-containing protein n=1 Tax=Ferruginibacter sp. SUN106 TaxID=2978348 RepID=UPI003D35FA69
MALFPFFTKKRLLSVADEELVVNAIRAAEKYTSGEVRVYVESHCRFVDPVDRAIEVFFGLKMEQTDDHNGVLIYVALKDRQLAIYGDEGIHAKVGKEYWQKAVKEMLQHFNKDNHVAGLCETIAMIGQTLHNEFPYEPNDDKNELPDEIVFGK